MSTRIEWGVIKHLTMRLTGEVPSKVVRVGSESGARYYVQTWPSVYIGVVKRTVTDWEEA